jgi:hypothetical protein
MAMNRIETEDAMRLEWELEGVTPRMIDWFWSNMEKCMLLWHPSQHEPLEWAKAPVQGTPSILFILPRRHGAMVHGRIFIFSWLILLRSQSNLSDI